jgi:hypothetical protein
VTVWGLTVVGMTFARWLSILGVLSLALCGLALSVGGATGLLAPTPPTILAPLMSFANLVLPWLRIGFVAWVAVGLWRSRGMEEA